MTIRIIINITRSDGISKVLYQGNQESEEEIEMPTDPVEEEDGEKESDEEEMNDAVDDGDCVLDVMGNKALDEIEMDHRCLLI